MTEEKKKPNKEETSNNTGKEAAGNKKPEFHKRSFAKGPRRDRGGADKKDDFDQRILDIARVTRVMAGGKRMRFRVCVAIGDKKGKIGVGVAKGADVTIAVNKAVNKARKSIVDVPLMNDTIPHEIFNKLSAAKIIFKPAKSGRGVIAGGVVRVILELAGIKNITSKILGTNNKLSNAKCALEALKNLKRVDVKKEIKSEKADQKNNQKNLEKRKKDSDKKQTEEKSAQDGSKGKK